MAGILTVAGQLARASEFRFDVFVTEHEHEYITVKQGRGKYTGKWAIAAGEAEFGRFYTGDVWSFKARGTDAYFWDLEEALVKAQELALEANQSKIDLLERKFPGEFRGGPHDMVVEGE